MSENITTNYPNLGKTDFQPFTNKPLFNKRLNSVSPSIIESIKQGSEKEETQEKDTSILSKIGYVLSYPFVKIYQLFTNLFSCCCGSGNLRSGNLFVAFEKDPGKVFVDDTIGSLEKLLKDFENDPKKAGEII